MTSRNNGDGCEERRWPSTRRWGWTDPDLTVGKLMRHFRWIDQQTVTVTLLALPQRYRITLFALAEGVKPEHAADWLLVRKTNDLPLTRTAWAAVKAEAVLLGLAPVEVVQ